MNVNITSMITCVDDAKRIAMDWQDGPWTRLYDFATTGMLNEAGPLLTEIHACFSKNSDGDLMALHRLAMYIQNEWIHNMAARWTSDDMLYLCYAMVEQYDIGITNHVAARRWVSDLCPAAHSTALQCQLRRLSLSLANGWTASDSVVRRCAARINILAGTMALNKDDPDWLWY